jgi:hypothetical protein
MKSVVVLTNLILQQFRNSLGCNCHNGLLFNVNFINVITWVITYYFF